jgi:hypothetical protein
MNNNIAPMPTQNPWAWVWAPNVGLCNEWIMTGDIAFEKLVSLETVN